MSRTELKPCPFCGCRPKLFRPGWGVYGNYVQCAARRCKVNPCTDSFPTREKAIAAWNRRKGEEAKHANAEAK